MKNLLLLIAVTFSLNIIGQVPTYVPATGLVAWYPFNGNANDETSNGYNGTVNGATLTTDRFGNPNSAYYFAISDIINFGFSNDFAITSSQTKSINLWFYSTTGKYPFLNKYENSVESNSNFFIGGDAPLFSQGDGITLTANGSNNLYQPIVAGNWFNVVVIYSGPNAIVDLYINAQHVQTAPLNYNSNISSRPLILQGTRMNIDYDNADGKIDDIGIWNRALTVCEIQDLYNAGLNSVVNTVTQTGPQLTADQTGAIYQWLDCDNGNQPIINETNQSYTPAITGNYAVEVDVNGCIVTSSCQLVDYTGIEELLKNEKELVMIVDFMGRETEFKPNTTLIFIYNDGTRERVMKLEE